MSNSGRAIRTSDPATKGDVWRVAGALESQRLHLTSVCFVAAGLLAGYVGFALMFNGESRSLAWSSTVLPAAFYTVVLTPLAALAVSIRSHRLAIAAMATWGFWLLVTLFGGVQMVFVGREGIFGAGVFHLLGAAVLVALGLWLCPLAPDEE